MIERAFGMTDTEMYRRMDQAKRRAEWELGDPDWAAIIVNAFLYPEQDAERLREESAE